ncbi:MAG: hypothetical protein MJZ22_03775 [Candidatus Saccharibacteria bacterium]|nr:hypothetical protein [Candidatus Saccharibacteria bacterium]
MGREKIGCIFTILAYSAATSSSSTMPHPEDLFFFISLMTIYAKIVAIGAMISKSFISLLISYFVVAQQCVSLYTNKNTRQ